MFLLCTCGEQLESFCKIAARDNRALARVLCVTEDEIDIKREWIEPPPYVEPPPPEKPKKPVDPRDKLNALNFLTKNLDE